MEQLINQLVSRTLAVKGTDAVEWPSGQGSPILDKFRMA